MRIIKRIKDVNIKNGRTVPSVMLAVSEECGELAKEVRVKYMSDCYKKEGVDGIIGEGCDIIIATIDLLLLEGYTEEQIESTISKKIDKWISKAKKTKFNVGDYVWDYVYGTGVVVDLFENGSNEDDCTIGVSFKNYENKLYCGDGRAFLMDKFKMLFLLDEELIQIDKKLPWKEKYKDTVSKIVDLVGNADREEAIYYLEITNNKFGIESISARNCKKDYTSTRVVEVRYFTEDEVNYILDCKENAIFEFMKRNNDK